MPVPVQKKYLSVINWYLERKSSKRVTAQRLRRWAIIFTTIAAAGLVVTAFSAGEQWAKHLGTISSVFLVKKRFSEQICVHFSHFIHFSLLIPKIFNIEL